MVTVERGEMKVIHFVKVNGGGPARGYFKEIGGRWIPIQIRSKIQAKYMLEVLEKDGFSMDLEAIKRELRDTGMPKFFISEKQDMAEVELAYWIMVFGEAVRAMPNSISRTLATLRFFNYPD